MTLTDKYVVVQGHECLSASIGCVLGCYNQQITPCSIIALGGGMKVWCDETDKEITSDMHGANWNFLKKYGIKYEKKQISQEHRQDYNYIDAASRREIDRGYIPIIRLKSSTLGYSRVFSQSERAIHYICVTGYGLDGYYICDAYVPTKTPSTYVGLADKKNILEAFAKAGCSYIIITNTQSIINKDFYSELRDKLIEAIKCYITGGIDKGRHLGKDASIYFFRTIIDKGPESNKEDFIEYNFQLKIYGFLPLKAIIFDCISKYMDDYRESMGHIMNEWNNISMFMLKCGLSNKAGRYQELMERVIKCNKREVELLGECLNKLEKYRG